MRLIDFYFDPEISGGREPVAERCRKAVRRTAIRVRQVIIRGEPPPVVLGTSPRDRGVQLHMM
jgi:hypothetical protein